MRRSNMKRKVLTVSFALSLLALFAYGAVVGATSGGLSKGGGTKATQIEGTWLLTVTTPPAAGRPPFEVLISFASGGVFLASAESDQGTPPQQGAWAKTGANEYTATALAFGHGPNPGDLFTDRKSTRLNSSHRC